MEEVARRYLQALGDADYDALMQLFAADAKVVSPLYGEQPATKFYRELLLDTQDSRLTFLDVFTNAQQRKASLNFQYRWTMADGAIVEFDCVDIFEFDTDGKITKLKIIYDTAQTRPSFDQLHRNPER